MVKKSERFAFVDLLETIAIFFVMFYHCGLYSSDFLSDGTVANYLNYFFSTILSTCVPLFFFVNGYLLFSRPFNIDKHIKKCIRLVVLTGVWAFILVVSKMLITGTPFSIKAIISKVLFIEIGWCNLLWYMGALVCIYIFFPLLKYAFDHDKKSFVFFMVICLVATMGVKLIDEVVAVMGVFTPIDIQKVWYPFMKMFNPFLGFRGYTLAYFCIGGFVYLLRDRIISVSRVKRNVISIVGIIISCLGLFALGVVYSRYIDQAYWDVVWDGYDSVFTLANVIFIYILSLNYTKDYKILKIVSANTLGIYFIHEIFINIVETFDLIIGVMYTYLGSMVYAAVVLAISLLTVLLMKKIPVLKNLV